MHHHQQQLRVTVINHESSFAAQISEAAGSLSRTIALTMFIERSQQL